jgi:hypothetical protein
VTCNYKNITIVNDASGAISAVMPQFGASLKSCNC